MAAAAEHQQPQRQPFASVSSPLAQPWLAKSVLLPASVTQDNAHDVLHLLNQSAPAASGITVVVDCSSLQYFDSSALAVLLASRRQALSEHRGFEVCNMPQRLSDLAQVYGVAELLREPRRKAPSAAPSQLEAGSPAQPPG